MSATLTHRPEVPASDQAPAPKKVGRWAVVAATAASVSADTSHDVAELRRMASLEPTDD